MFFNAVEFATAFFVGGIVPQKKILVVLSGMWYHPAPIGQFAVQTKIFVWSE